MSLTSPPQTRSFTDPAGYGARFLTYSQFDPALGTLNGLRISISARPAGSVAIENLEAGTAPIQFDYSASAQLSVFAPGGGLLAEYGLFTSASTLLPGFDGSADFAGTSGGQASASASGGGLPVNLAMTGPDRAAFIGNGTLDLAVSDRVTNSVVGAANMRVRAAASAVGDVTLEYDYTPPSSGGGGGGSVFTWGGGGSFAKIINTFDVVFEGPRPVTVTTAPQVFRLDPRTTGWRDDLAVAPFNPALGTLSLVHLRLATTLDATAAIESHTDAAGAATIWQRVDTTLSRGTTGITAQTLDATRSLGFGPADGTDDFAGQGGTLDGGRHVAPVKLTSLGNAADLQAFSGTQPVALALATSSAGSIHATGNWLAEIAAQSGAVVEIAYTYVVEAATAAVLVDDTTSGLAATVAAETYQGPVATLQHQFINITPDNLNIAATTDNWFIRTGNGTDAIAARGGINVLDGGGGSNFLTGGFGQDTFFIDVREAAASVWSTIVDFQSGDAVTVWGVTAADFALNWFENQGAPAATGLTLHATAAARPTASLTLPGYSTADLTNGALAVSFGVSELSSYLHIRAT